MKILVAGNLDTSLVHSLEDKGFELVYTKANYNLLEGLWFHPDMQMTVYQSKIICDPYMYNLYLDTPDQASMEFVCGETKTKCTYPYDIAYNIKAVGKHVFHNFKYTDSVLQRLIPVEDRIDVSQGYSGCSICTVSENAIITADTGIHKAAVKCNIDSLLIRPGHIALEGFDYGFIGGASFTYRGEVFFFGNIKTHPDYDMICRFCADHGAKIISLSDGNLTDYGSAITLD